MSWLARWRRSWPHLRAGLIFVHLAAVLVMCTPGPGRLLNRSQWKSAESQAQFAGWANRLRSIGIDTTAAGLEAWLWDRAGEYASVRRRIERPFAPYVQRLHLYQGWSLFSQPQRHPVRLHVDLDRGDGWQPIHVQGSSEHTWRRAQLSHHRLRKLIGRVGRRKNLGSYGRLVDWLARVAAADFPDGQRLRVRLYRYRTAAPGDRVADGTFTDERIIDLARVGLEQRP
jgi:hypothetical protein